ncbi:zf-HC2 domain-containing protein [Corynebacterium sp. UBA2622]|uniref:zf-HC2 domain-containing protein n=1 Tax=Corynebacterium sp. UBA2622 TaxID=1946393 RepID=UPI0025BD3F5E|nr:zf-HC2 domain-containing protein [Corynebacterium sp. UBA2622]
MLSHEEVQAALSARMDGETAGLDDAVVDAHLEQCGECRAYWDRLLSLSRNLSFVEVGGGMAPPPDLSEVILAGVESEWRRFARRRSAALAVGRLTLGILAVMWAVWAVRLVVTTGGMVPVDVPAASGGVGGTDSSDLAGLLISAAAVRFGVALALALAAWKPGQIPGILLVVGTMFTFTLGFAVRDMILYSAHGVLGHVLILLLTLLSLAVTWAVDRGTDMRRAWRLLSADPA